MASVVSRRLTRREVLKVGGTLLAGAIVAACAPAPAATPTPAPAPKPAAPAPAAPTAAPTAKPAAGAPSPTSAPAKPAEAPPTPTPAPAKPAAPAATAAPKKEPVTLRFHDPQSTHSTWIEKRTKEFSAEVPWITVRVEAVPGWVEYFVKVRTMHAGGQLGDNVYSIQGEGYYQSFVAKGMLREHDDLVKAFNYDLSQHYKAQVEGAKYRGKMYSLPENIHLGGAGLMYNQKIFDEAGVSYPTMDWTWEDLIKAAGKLLKSKSGKVEIWGILLNTNSIELTENTLRSYGGAIVAPDGKTCTLDKPEAVAAIKMMQDLVLKYKVHPTPDPQLNQQQYFLGGSVAMFQTGAWSLSNIVNLAKDKFYPGAVLLPKGPTAKHGTNVGGDFQCVTAASKHPEEAFQVDMFLCNKESGVRKVLEGAFAPGARPDVWTDKRLVDRHPAYRIWADALFTAESKYLPWNFRGPEISDAFGNGLQPVFLGRATPEEGAKATAAAIQKILDMPPVS